MRALALLALALLVVFAFGSAVRNGWILLDDHEYVFENPYVRAGLTWRGVLHFLTSGHVSNWHPLTSSSHMLDVTLFGVDPAGPHAVNVGLHALGSLLAACVLFGYTRQWWPSFAVAVLFALHPLRVESVAWISERKDVLSGVLFWITLDAYRRWTVRGGIGRYAWVCAAFALGLMAKPMLVTLPCVLLLLDAWPLGRLRNAGEVWPRIREKLPLLGIALASALVTYVVQRSSGAVAAEERFPLSTRIANAPVSAATYIGMTLWPRDLAPFYPSERLESFVIPLLAAALLGAITLACWRLRPRHPEMIVGWLWFLGMLVPVLGLVQVGGQAFADRYTYLPSIGLALGIVFPLGSFAARAASRRLAALVALAAVALVLAEGTRRQTELWKDTQTLFGHTLAVTRDNAFAESVLGNGFLVAGEYQRGIERLERSLQLWPGESQVHNNLGIAYAALHRNEEALSHFRLVRAADTTVEFHCNVGAVLDEMNRTDEACAEFRAALALDPRHFRSLQKLGMALASQGKLEEAAHVLARALEQKPEDLQASFWMGLVRSSSGDAADAIRWYEVVLRQDPEHAAALNNLAWIRATHRDAALRDGAAAVRCAEHALAKNTQPDAILVSTLAAAYAEAGRFADAVRTAENAVRLAQQGGDAATVERFREQLALYRAGKPVRD